MAVTDRSGRGAEWRLPLLNGRSPAKPPALGMGWSDAFAVHQAGCAAPHNDRAAQQAAKSGRWQLSFKDTQAYGFPPSDERFDWSSSSFSGSAESGSAVSGISSSGSPISTDPRGG